MEDAVDAVKALKNCGIDTTLDHLGENVTNRSEAASAVQELITLLDYLDEQGVKSGVSIKLSQIGLVLDADFCLDNLVKILNRAGEAGIFVRIDMEESQVTDQTLNIFRRAQDRFGVDQVGIVLQAYLYRTADDLLDLIRSGTKVRLCKGAYKEPQNVAFPNKKDVDRNFDRLTRILLDESLAQRSQISSDGGLPPIPAVATHDQQRIEFAVNYAADIGLDKRGLEFQMLYGIRTDLQESLVQQGFPVRVYVPYGTEWYPYYVRRLAERPANLWFFLSNFFRRS
jgi:proline dehydrogenase